MLRYNTLTPDRRFVIPETYDQWRRCIEVDCGIPLTPAFIDQRLNELATPSDFRTHQFLSLYGEAHRDRVIRWFRQAGAGA
jgi:hypothetical protein